jgi:hypothetical protein
MRRQIASDPTDSGVDDPSCANAAVRRAKKSFVPEAHGRVLSHMSLADIMLRQRRR